MKAKSTELFENFAGTTGEITATHIAGHLIVRKKSHPLDAKTDSQKIMRQYFSVYTRNWAKLTHAQRDKWNAAAREASANKTYFGITGKISGFNLYVKSNINLKLINISTDLQEPVRNIPQNPPCVKPSEISGNSIIVELTENVHTDDTVILRVAPIQIGRSDNYKGLRQMGTIAGGSRQTDITQKFHELFAPPLNGERIQIQIHAINKKSGYASAKRDALLNTTIPQ